MASIRDCFRKLGRAISKADRQLIESHILAGITPVEAVRLTLRESNQELLDIVSKVQLAGGEIQRRPNALVDAREIQMRNLEKLQVERAAVQRKMGEVTEQLQDIEAIENFVAEYPSRRGFFVAEDIDIDNDQHLAAILSPMLFDPDQRPMLQAGRLGLKGNTPMELVKSFTALRDKAHGLHARLRTLDEQNRNIDDRIRTVFHGERRNEARDQRGNYIIMEPIRPPGRDQGDLFADADVPQSQKAVEAVANYKVRVRQEETGTLPTGLNVVNNADDAAHVMASIRRQAQEGMWALVLDQNNRVLSVVRHSKGTYDGTSVYPSVMAGAILTTPGATKVWFAHNHPSGVAQPSQADEMITQKLTTTLENTDVTVAGHVVIGSGAAGYSELGPDGRAIGMARPFKPLPRRMEVPITERILRARVDELDTLHGPTEVKALLTEMDPPDGVLILDNRHRPLGYLSMDPDQMRSLKTTRGHQRLLQAFSELGGGAAMVFTKADDPAITENMGFWANANEFRILDHFIREGGTGEIQTVSDFGRRPPVSGTTFYQSQEPKLQALHNLTSENLEFSDKLGGLAVPSIAVMPEGKDIQGFGEITLIGTRELGDPQQVPLFDADAYAVRFPKANYKPSAHDIVTELLAEVEDIAKAIGGSKYSGLPDFLWEHMRRHPDPDRLIQHMLTDNTSKAWFLKEVYNDTPQARLDDVRPGYVWGWSPRILKFFAGDLSAENLEWEHLSRQRHMRKAGEAVRNAIREYFIGREPKIPAEAGPLEEAARAERIYARATDFIHRAGIMNEDGSLVISVYDRLKRDVERKGSQNINDVDTQTYLDGRIQALRAENDYKIWAERKIRSRMGDPRIKISGRWEPYTLANIVRKMKGKLRGTEDFFPSEGMLRAKAAARIKSMPEARRRAIEQIGTPDEVDTAREAAQRMVFSWTTEMAGWWPFISADSIYDHSTDAAREAMAYTVQNFNRPGYKGTDAQALKAGLTRAGFEGPFPDHIIEQGLDAIAAFVQAPVPYFEAKPQRAVDLSEFSGAVIPMDASPATRAILAKHGIVYKEYQLGREGRQNRTNATNELQQQLSQAGERTLFQSEIGFTSGLLNAARALDLEQAPAKDMLGRLRKMPGASSLELEALDVPGFIEAKGDEQLTKDELVAYIMANGIEVVETQLGGEFVPQPELTVTINSDFEAFEKYGMEDIYEDEYLYSRNAIWDVSDFHSDFTFQIIEDMDAGNVAVTPDDGMTWLEIDAPINEQTRVHAEDAIEAYIFKNSGGVEFDRVAENVGQQIDGGTNFREVILHMPPVPPEGRPFQWVDFEAGHHDEKNIIAFFLATDRIGPNGERILFLEEVQSDWHQRGKRFGYAMPVPDIPAFEVEETEMQWVAVDPATREPISYGKLQSGQPREIAVGKGVVGYGAMDKSPVDDTLRSQVAARDYLTNHLSTLHQEAVAANLSSVPAGPFRGNAWVTLAMKRAIRLAAEQGYDQLAWSTGDIINTRSNFVQDIDKIVYDPRNADVYTYDAQGTELDHGPMDDQSLSDYIGAENLQKIQDQVSEHANRYDVIGGVESDIVNENPSFIDYIEFSANQDLIQLLYDKGEQAASEFLKNEAEAGDLFVAIDINGEYRRDRNGNILVSKNREYMAEWLENDLYEDFDSLPKLEGMGLHVTTTRGTKMLNFYDKTLVNMTNRAARKLDPEAEVKWKGQELPDAAAQLERLLDARRLANMAWDSFSQARDLGQHEQATFHRQNFDNHVETIKQAEAQQVPGPKVHALDITPKVREMAMLGMTLFQDKHRGSITFDADNRAVIRLGKASNLSTFLHESGHLYLEIMGDLAEQATGPRQVIADYQKILEFLEVNSRREITREHHEKWARAFERYLAEGKAPSADLQGVFAAFAQWLTKIYAKLVLYAGFDMNDEIRGVMDRMLATDEAITSAENTQEFRPLYSSAEEMGVSQERFEVYKDLISRAHQDAFDKEAKKMLAYLEREAKVWWQSEREKVLAEVQAEVWAQPVYRALAMFQRGENPDGTTPDRAIFKLGKDDLIRRYGKEFIKGLPKPWVYTIKRGVDADVAAAIFGFSSADEMIQEMMRVGKMDAVIEAETDLRMRERFPDPLVDGTLAADAVTVVHNEKRAQLLAAELRSLRKQMRQDKKIVSAVSRESARTDREARAANAGMLPNRGELAIIKKLVRDEIDAMRIRAVNPNKYRIAEQKAGRKAFNAAAKGDYQTAYQEKLKQIRNHELFRAATRAKEESGRTQKYLKKFESKTVQQRLGKSGMLDQILAVIEGIDFRTVSLAQVDRNAAMAEMLQAVEDGRLVVPPATLNKLRDMGTNWKDLTVDEFRDMRDIVRQLEHKAKTLAEGVLNGEKVLLQDAVNEVADQILENNKFVPAGVSEPSLSDKGKRSLKQGVMAWLRASSIARVLDQSGFGALTRRVIVPIRRAYAEKLIPGLKKAQKDVSDLYLKHYSKSELGDMHKKRYVEAMGESLSKADLLSIALNWGNAGNRAAMLGGIKRDGSPAYTEQGIQAVLQTLDARDVDFINDIWAYLDSYWPALSEAEQRRRGIAPQKVEALPFTFKGRDGQELTAKGGYYPLAYDRRHSERVKDVELQDLYKKMGNGVFITAQTRSGSTFERVQNHGMVVRLGLHTIDLHLREVVRDISIGDEVNFIKRLLNDKEIRAAFNNTGNDTALEALNLWLTDAAVGELPAEGVVEQSVAWIRTGFVKAKLGWNLMTTLLQFTGIFQTIAVIGSQAYGMGLGKFLQNPVKMYKFVMEQSAFMHTRYIDSTAFDKDVLDTQAHLNSVFGAAPTRLKTWSKAASATFFYPIAKAQSLVDVTTWLGAYWKGRNVKNLSDADAIIYADVQVENAQTSGFYSDRSGLERGTTGTKKNRQSQFIRIWTTLISYMLAKSNIAYEKGVALKRRPTLKGAVYFATDLMLLYTMEGIAAAIIYDQWPDEDDDEGWGWWVAKATVDSAVSGIPFVREIPAARFGGGNTAIGSLGDDIYTLGQQIQQGEVDEALLKNLNNVGGTLFHYPSSQTNRLLDAYWAEDEVEFYEWLTGVRGE